MYEMRSDPLDGVRLKLRRTDEQLSSLNAEFVAFRDRKPYALRGYYDHKRRDLSIFEAIREGPDPMWGIKVGEILHNLRSSLDHLVWQLVILETGKPPTTTKTGFPVFLSAAGYNGPRGAVLMLNGVGNAARALIERAQPYSTGEGVGDPLWELHELSNFDKHRTLHLTGSSLETGRLDLPSILPGIQVVEQYVRPPGPLEDGALLAKIRLSGIGWPFIVPEPEMKVEGNLAIRIVFDQGSPAVGGAMVIPALGTIGQRVHETIERIALKIFKVGL